MAWTGYLDEDERYISEFPEANEVDFICIPIAKLIEKEGKLSLKDIITKTGFARQTIHDHLKHLVNDKILTREVVKTQGRGRPKIFYSRTDIPIKTLKSQFIALRFSTLKQICSYQKNNKCKKNNEQCDFDLCPLKVRLKK